MRKRFTKIALSAAFVLAMALTFGCSDNKDDDNPPPTPAISSSSGGDNPGSSSSGNTVGTSSSGGSVVVSSSSGGNASISSSSVTGGGGSSSSAGSNGGGGEIVYGDDVPYEGVTYKTVKIGTQTWFQRNLNYAVTGSKCGNGISLSDANTATCDTYGRLYNWATAMALDASCNSSTCASQVSAKHRGICPSGWHIPSNEDWDKLMRYVDGNTGTSSPYDSETAGRYLKARDGWNSGGNGEDTFGFSALPGGFGESDGYFGDVGYYGYWWSASEGNSGFAYYRGMFYDYEGADYNDGNKYKLFSVRCVKD